MMNRVALLWISLCALPMLGTAQEVVELRWGAPSVHEVDDQNRFKRLNCLDCTYADSLASTPVYNGVLRGWQNLELEVLETAPLRADELTAFIKNVWPANFVVSSQQVTVRKQAETHYQLNAVRQLPNGSAERLVRFRLRATGTSSPVKPQAPAFRVNSQNSVLATGDWYRLGIVSDGMYKITPEFLTSMGIPAASVNPNNIRIYGNGGGMLPEDNAAFRYDDLVENPIEVVGASDGRFDQGDYVLFYAEGPNKWRFNESTRQFQHELNLYADTNYYFLTVSLGPGRRIDPVEPAPAITRTATSFDLLLFHEKDEVNLIRSGRKWYGESFDLVNSRDYTFNLTNRVAGSPVRIRAGVAARSLGVASDFQLRSNGALLTAINIPATSSYYLDFYMRDGFVDLMHAPAGNSLTLSLSYAKPNNFSLGWLDYLEVHCRSDLNLAAFGNQLLFRDGNSVETGAVTRFDLAGIATSDQVWDVTELNNIRRMTLSASARGSYFDRPTDTLRTFIAFSGNNFPSPLPMGTVGNQNLHGIAQADYIIVSHPAFLAASNRLAALHASREGITSVVVTPQLIYNEFSSGRQDITAIRAFVKHLYDKAPAGQEPRFLLLMGAASFDFKNRIAGNTNFVPTFQSPNSNNPLDSYCADSYFGLLDDQEGSFAVGGNDRMDIAIGRMPAKTVQQAEDMVSKVEAYLDGRNHGDWKNQIMLVADDEDNNLHLNDSEVMANHIASRYPNGIVKKVFFDAYRQESRPGGTRYPTVNRDINARMNLGALIVSYMGHGGINGWSEERVLTIPEIQAWNSGGKLPLMVTATCEFTRYDNPSFTSAGEWVLLNPRGGAVALMTTTRVTFTNFNFSLSTRIYRDELFTKVGGKYQTLGEVFMRAANPELSNVNTRNFCLLGDPALTLAFPEQNAAVTHINNVQISAVPDTIRALARVRISGEMRDAVTQQKLTGFNGILTPTVLDKPSNITTLANDVNSFARNYDEFRNIIYRGRATISNGEWSFQFIVPRDIAYNFGQGRINLYATNQQTDAAGDFREVIVGGTDTNFVPDNTGPQLTLFMNDRSFVNGGITDQNPVFVAQLMDSSGINTVGSGIGRDITLIRNSEVNSPIVLNEFYEASLDDYTRGEIRYPFFRLEPGNYNLRMKVWDVHNNSADAGLDFVVAENSKLAIANLLNYPNPFTTHTTFHFDHNKPGQPLDIMLQVYTVSGKLVKSMAQTISTSGFHADQLHWDGLDDFGDRIGRGVYIYRLRVRSADGESVQDTQKLVILR